MPGRPTRMRAGSLAGVFVMIAITATIAAAAGQIMSTALGAPGPGRFAAADAVVRANPKVQLGHGDNADTVDVQRSALLAPAALARIASIPEVKAATGDVAFPLTVIGPDGRPLDSRGGGPAHGHGWPSAALTPYRLIAGRAPASGNQVVVDAPLARAGHLHVGGSVRLVTPAGPTDLRLSGIATASHAQLYRQSSVFVTEQRAQQLSGLGPGFNAIAVRADPEHNTAALRRDVAAIVGGDAQVLDHRQAAAADAGDPRAFDRIELVAVVASSGGITLGIAIFVLSGTVAFAIQGRRRELALIRAIGATPSQVRRMLLVETVLIGLAAGAAGCLAAGALAGWFTRALVSVGIAPDGFSITPMWIPYMIAIGASGVVALLATVVAAHRTLAIRPGEALAEAALPDRRMGIIRAILGLIALGGGIALVVVLSAHALSYATLAAFCFMIAVVLLGPAVVGWPTALAGQALRATGGSGFLAAAALRTGRFRVGAVAAAIALVVALAGAQVLSLATAQRATERATAQRVHADQVLVSRAGGGLPPSVAAAAARIPGVTAAASVSTKVYLLDRHLTNQGDSWDAAGLDPAGTRTSLELGVDEGSLAELTGDRVAVSETIARHGVGPGSVLHARLADATPALLRVVAVYRHANGLGDVVLPRALALHHAQAPLDSAVFIRAPQRGPAARALGALTRSVPTAALESRDRYLDDVRAQGQDNARARWVVVALMILVSVMAAFNTGAMAASERRRELVLARLSGATRAQVIGALTLETLFATVAGIAVGALVALTSLVGAGSDPAGGPLAVPLGQVALVLGAAVALGFVGTLVPAGLVGRARLTAFAGARE